MKRSGWNKKGKILKRKKKKGNTLKIVTVVTAVAKNTVTTLRANRSPFHMDLQVEILAEAVVWILIIPIVQSFLRPQGD
jgi:hypothetical protein